LHNIHAPITGRYIPKANKAISVVFMPASLRLTDTGVNAVGGEEAEGFLRERQSQRHLNLEAAFTYGV
jgi:hypothetical protein